MWVDEICRLCAQVSEVLLPIFEKNGDRARLDLKIKKCLSISITENDQKPQNICYSCCNKLEDLNDFIEICHSADYKFESILFAQQSEQQSIIEERKWPDEKITQMTHESQMVQHDGVIVVGKVDETQKLNINNRECQDILLMVELKYKDVEIDPQSAELMKQNKIIYQDNQMIPEKQIVFPQGVLRHSDDFTKIQQEKTVQNINLSNLQYAETQQTYIEQPIELIKANTYVIQENKTKTKPKPFPCSHCNKSFMRRSNLTAHMSAHTQVKPFQCDQCEKTFAIRRNLTVHQRLHSGQFSCDFCGKAFPMKGKLERHRRTHTGEKPFACTVPGCDKAFADKRNLEAHSRSHTQEKPHVCSICSRAFGSKSHMIDHQKVHCKDAAYTCDSCGKSFKWKTTLTRHLRSHTGEKCVCVDCGKQFGRKSQLSKHRKIHAVPNEVLQVDSVHYLEVSNVNL